jgi:Raf kinase inhibitor-like YbhB/YbcL family protein
MPSAVLADRKKLQVVCLAFRDGGLIPARYTCEGEDINPSLLIKNVPPEAQSLVVIVDDPDAPKETWLHWLVWNVPVVDHIGEDEVPGEQGVNDFGRIGYGGPCPPSGTHRYFFRVYALNDTIDREVGSNRQQVEDAMQGHILAYGELVGLYRKSG